jgi:hypothetical protein
MSGSAESGLARHLIQIRMNGSEKFNCLQRTTGYRKMTSSEIHDGSEKGILSLVCRVGKFLDSAHSIFIWQRLGLAVLTLLAGVVFGSGVHAPRDLAAQDRPPAMRIIPPVTVETPKVTFTGIDWAPPIFPNFDPVAVTTPKVTFTGIGASPAAKPAIPWMAPTPRIGGKRQ